MLPPYLLACPDAIPALYFPIEERLTKLVSRLSTCRAHQHIVSVRSSACDGQTLAREQILAAIRLIRKPIGQQFFCYQS